MSKAEQLIDTYLSEDFTFGHVSKVRKAVKKFKDAKLDVRNDSIVIEISDRRDRMNLANALSKLGFDAVDADGKITIWDDDED